MKIRQMTALFAGVTAAASPAGELIGTEQALQMAESPAGHASRPIAILVMAVGRSGSSMVGEFFQQNEDVLYFYEPCRNPRKHIEGLECLALLKRLTQCTFSLEDSAWISEDELALRNGSPELKDVSEAPDGEQFVRAHEELIETCKQRRAVAVKSIRLYDGLGDQDYDVSGLKVLHLVRDPRGVVRSQQEHLDVKRWETHNANNSTVTARAGGTSICGTYKSQLDTSKKLEESRYLLVRYEDIATSPELAVELIYCWAGLGVVPANVKTWIYINTNMASCDDGAQRRRHSGTRTRCLQYSSAEYDELGGPITWDQNSFDHAEPGMSAEGGVLTRIQRRSLITIDVQVSGSSNIEGTLADCIENTHEAKRNPYGTRRQSANMASMWRTLMSEEDAQAVWDACQDSEVMRALGYHV